MALSKWYLPVMLVCFLLPTAECRGQWKQYDGPYGGNVHCIATYDSAIFIGLDGAVYESTDVGLNWKLRGRGLSINSPVEALALCGSSLFASTPDGIYRSNDTEENWSIVSRDSPTYFQSLFLTSTATAVYSIDKSSNLGSVTTDNGNHWSRIDTNLSQAAKLQCSMRVGSTTYFAGNWIIATSDTNPVFRVLAVPPADRLWNICAMTRIANVLIAFTDDAHALRSVDDGRTWDEASFILPSGSGNVFYATIGSKIIAASSSGTAFLSADSGLTWSEQANPLALGSVNSLRSIADKLIGGSSAFGFLVSDDSGNSWSQRNRGIKHIYALRVAGRGATIFAATSAGLFLSYDHGANWLQRSVHSTLEWCETLFLDGPKLYVSTNGGKDDGMYVSSDYGSSWTFSSVPEQYTSIYVIYRTGSSLLAGGSISGYGLGLWISSDSGFSWSDCLSGSGVSNLNYIYDIAGANHITIASGYGGTYRSEDDGLDWVPCPGTSSQYTGMAVAACDSVFFHSSYDAYTYAPNEITISTDGGLSWENVKDSSVTANGYVTSFASAQHAMFASNDHTGVYVTSDAGNHWTNVSLGLGDSSVLSLSVYGDELIACTAHAGIWHRPIKEMLSPAKVENVVTSSFTVYPNPTSRSIRVSWPGMDREVSAQLIDEKGSRVWSHTENFSGGSLLLHFEGIQTGAYRLELQSAHNLQTVPIVIQY